MHGHASALEGARDDLRRRLEVAEALGAERDQRLALGVAKQAQLESALTSLHAHASALEEAREELRRRVEVSEAVIPPLQRTLEEKEARLVSGGHEYQRVESAMGQLAAHARALETARDALRSEVTSLQARVDAGAHLQQIADARQAHLVAARDVAGHTNAALAKLRAHARALEAARDIALSRVQLLESELTAAMAVGPRLQQLVDEKDAQLALAAAELAATAATGTHLQVLAGEKDAQLFRADAALAIARSEADALARGLANREEELVAIRQSRSWRVTAPLRVVISWLRTDR